jgi:hypothetical protein
VTDEIDRAEQAEDEDASEHNIVEQIIFLSTRRIRL